MMRARPGMWIVSVACVWVMGCGGSRGNDGGGNGGGNGGGVNVPPTTKVLNADTLSALSAVSADQTTFTFQARTSQLEQLQTGDIIVSSVHPPMLPYGTLRRVQTVEESGGAVSVTTSPASLADAVKDGSLHERFSPTPSDSGATSKVRPLQAVIGQLVFPIKKTVLFDGDDDPDTDHDQVTLEGSLSMTPDVVIDIDISNFVLQSASIAVEGDVIADLTLHADREADFPIFDTTVHTQPFTPVIFPLGPIPVVFVPVLEIHVGADGSVTAAMTAHVTFEADGAVGFGYNGGFSPILSLDPSGSADVPDFLESGKATGTFWLGAKFKVAFYGLAGVYVESRFFGELGLDVAACPWWELFVGVEGTAGAFVEVNVALFDVFGFSGTILDWHTDPLQKKVSVADSGGCTPSQAPGEIVSWARSYGADSIDFPIAVVATADSGALVAGSTYSFTPQTDATLMKLDPFGHVAWQLAYDDLDAGIAVIPIQDGYYLLAGENTVSDFLTPPFLPPAFQNAVDPPAYLLRLDGNGSPVWARAIASDAESLDAVGMAQLPDGSVVVAGTVGDPPAGEHVWLARFEPSGQLTWARKLNDGGAAAQSLIVDSAGDIVLLASAGATYDVLLKVDAQGDSLWEARYGSSHNNFAAEVVERPDGYTLVGHLGNDAQVNHVDHDGNLLWAKHMDSDAHELIEMPDGTHIEAPDETPYDEAYAADVFPNGDLLVSGKAELGEEANVWVLRMDGNDQAVWIRLYSGTREDVGGGWLEFARVASTVAVTPDGGALIGGYSASFSHAPDPTSFDIDMWILKIRGSGAVDLDSGSGATAGAVGGEIYDVNHFGSVDLSVELDALDLIVEAFTPVVYSPALEVARQGGAE